MGNNSQATGEVYGIGRSCLGCLGTVVVGAGIRVRPRGSRCASPGGRWTPLGRWHGVGQLRDSEGARYGMYLQFESYPNMDFRNQATTCCSMSGYAQVCTARGASYRFYVNGTLSGAWLRADLAKVSLGLSESEHPKLPRTFQLSGVWRGPNLVLDDQKSMFVDFLPGGNLTPNPISSAPVPERHAKVTVSWGDRGDLEPTCESIRASDH